MRVRDMWAGAAAGAVLAVAGGVAVNGAVGDAEAQAGFAVTPGQLQTNQRISQAAVRRSNRALNYLAPIRTAESDAADSGDDGVKPLVGVPGAGRGWTSGQIADGAITTPKINHGSVTMIKLEAGVATRFPRTAVVSETGALVRGRGATAAQDAGGGLFTVEFDSVVRECVYQATVGGTGTTYAGSGEISVYGHPTENDTVVVATHDSSGASAARPFHLAVLC